MSQPNESLFRTLFNTLYVFNQPYAQRARRIALVALGITSSVIFGTLLAPYPIIPSMVMGLIVTVAIFIFGSLRISGPSAFFFLLAYALVTGHGRSMRYGAFRYDAAPNRPCIERS